MSDKHPSFFESVERNFDKAAVHTGLPKGLLEQIKVCNAVYQISNASPANQPPRASVSGLVDNGSVHPRVKNWKKTKRFTHSAITDHGACCLPRVAPVPWQREV